MVVNLPMTMSASAANSVDETIAADAVHDPFADTADEVLADYTVSGHAGAFSALVARHSTRYYHVAYRLVLNQQDAEDIVQTAFVKLWQGKARWKAGKKAKFTSWFHRIVHNAAIDVLRRRKPSSSLDVTPLVDGQPAQDDTLVQNQETDALHSALHSLTDKQRGAVVYFYYENLPQKEIARIMRCSVKAVESLLSRAKQELKGALEKDGHKR